MSARIGVIGCGWWSTYAHLPALHEHPGAEIVALADPDPVRLDAAAAAFDVTRTFASAEAMLDAVDLDGAVVAVPHAFHHAPARAALARGVHVLVEKPLTLTVADARDLQALADERGVELVVGYPWQYNAHVLALRDAIAAGQIGAIEHVSFLYASIVRELYRGDPEPYREVFGYPVNAPASNTYSDPALAGGGQGQTQITHAAGLLLWMTGLEVAEVSALSRCFELPVDLADGVVLGFAGGALGTITSTGGVTVGQQELVRCEVFGRDGHVQLDVNRGTASVHRAGGVSELPQLAPEHRNPERAPTRNLVGIALGRERNGSPGTVGVGAVELVAAMYQSARERRIVRTEDL